jgi:hypothetical protein
MTKQIFKTLLTETKNVLQSVKGALHKKTRLNYFSKLENVTHLSTLKKINRELQAFQKIKTETPKTNNKTSPVQNLTSKIIKAIPKLPKVSKIAKVHKLKEFFISSMVKLKFEFTTNQKDGSSHFYTESKPFAMKITDYTRAEAINIFEDQIDQKFNEMSSGEDSSQHKNVWVDSYYNLQINNFSGIEATQEANTFMRSAQPLQYEFIKSSDSLNKNDGFCVSDVMIEIYSKHIPTLDLKRFNDLCLRVRHLGNDTYEEYLAKQKWKLEDGVTPKMLYEICKILDISHYSYDITNKCFLKHIPKNRNYPALVYYCVNSHMYHVENKEVALKLAMGAKDIEHKIKSHVLDEEIGAKIINMPQKQLSKILI